MGLPIAAAAIMGGSSLLSGILGGRAAKKSARSMAQIAEQIAEQTRFARGVYEAGEERARPFREALFPNILSTLQDPSSLTGTPAFSATLGPLAESFQTLRGQAQERLPRGGAQQSLLARSFSDEARARTGLLSSLFQRYEDIGLGLAQGPGAGVGVQAGLGGAQALGGLLGPLGDITSAGLGQIGQAGGGLGESLFELFNRPAGTSPAQTFSPSFQPGTFTLE